MHRGGAAIARGSVGEDLGKPQNNFEPSICAIAWYATCMLLMRTFRLLILGRSRAARLPAVRPPNISIQENASSEPTPIGRGHVDLLQVIRNHPAQYSFLPSARQPSRSFVSMAPKTWMDTNVGLISAEV